MTLDLKTRRPCPHTHYITKDRSYLEETLATFEIWLGLF